MATRPLELNNQPGRKSVFIHFHPWLFKSAFHLSSGFMNLNAAAASAPPAKLPAR